MQVGSCIREKDVLEADGSRGSVPGAVDCDDDDAGYRVLAIGEADGDTALRQDCAEAGALRVLAIDPEPSMIDLPTLPGQAGVCGELGAPEATLYYKWGIPSSGFISMALDYQKGICTVEVS